MWYLDKIEDVYSIKKWTGRHIWDPFNIILDWWHFKLFNFLICICVCLLIDTSTCECKYLQSSEEDIGSPQAAIRSSYEYPNITAGNQTTNKLSTRTVFAFK